MLTAETATVSTSLASMAKIKFDISEAALALAASIKICATTIKQTTGQDLVSPIFVKIPQTDCGLEFSAGNSSFARILQDSLLVTPWENFSLESLARPTGHLNATYSQMEKIKTALIAAGDLHYSNVWVETNF